MKRIYILGACALAFAPLSQSFAHDTDPSAERLEADVRFLADDALMGREAGTPGYDMAAGYVAGHFAAMGLKPSANGTYFQQVPLVEYRNDEAKANALQIVGLPEGTELVAKEDYFTSGTPRVEEGFIEGPLVFVGYAFAADGYPRDDFTGVDVKDKIAVVLRGAPTNLNTEERAHFGATKSQRLSERGAVGVISLWTPETEKGFAWEEAKKYYATDEGGMVWVTDEGAPYTSAPNILATATISPGLSEMLFENQPVSWEQVIEAENDPDKWVRSFDMGLTGRIDFANVLEPLESPNVIGIIPGSDPELAHEVVVVTAHLDHEGIKPTEKEGDDEIYNGAMDNASGTAAIMEVARIMVEEPPRRTVMFLALTAEEKGLRGSAYFAKHPVLEEGQKIVANVNLDMPVMTYEFTDVVAFGAERSTMFPIVEKAAADAGVTLSPDPQPQEGYFTRSDQYMFVREGIPAVYLDTGYGGDGAVEFPAFLRDHYHEPSDEADRLLYDQLARFTAVNIAIVEGVANMDEAPRWKKGDFFGTTFGGPMED